LIVFDKTEITNTSSFLHVILYSVPCNLLHWTDSDVVVDYIRPTSTT